MESIWKIRNGLKFGIACKAIDIPMATLNVIRGELENETFFKVTPVIETWTLISQVRRCGCEETALVLAMFYFFKVVNSKVS